MKIVSIVGTRPQLIKCALLSHELRKEHEEILVHTGQHYDHTMSEIFFEELLIPRPDYSLNIGSGPHGWQTGEMLAKLESVLQLEKPELVLTYGDTNSTLAGALAAAKLQLRVAHVEAGLRSFDRTMPEEINRVITDHISSLCFCPTVTAVMNLSREGIITGVHYVGDVMYDVLLQNMKISNNKSRICQMMGLKRKDYLVITIHRPSNTDNFDRLASIIDALSMVAKLVIFPLHPRTKKFLDVYGLLDRIPRNVKLIEPLGYLDMLQLMKGAEKILTDSGGIQKEAYMMSVPCITLRDNTEWVETVEEGWNVLVGADKDRIIEEIGAPFPTKKTGNLFGNGDARLKIAKIIGELN